MFRQLQAHSDHRYGPMFLHNQNQPNDSSKLFVATTRRLKLLLCLMYTLGKSYLFGESLVPLSMHCVGKMISTIFLSWNVIGNLQRVRISYTTFQMLHGISYNSE
ncbi:hypothetical protein ACOME3_006832 [Neoechinorhynchus agilis]